MSSRKILFSLLFFITLCNQSVFAQSDSTLIALPDSANLRQVDDTLTLKPSLVTKSPWGAVLRSAVLPGFGQFYNESYWKIPVIGGLLIWFGYNYVDNHDKYTQFRDLYLASGSETHRIQRNFYNDQRDLFAISFVLTYLANLVDAYVDAHLFSFDVEDTFDIRGHTTSLSVRVPL